MVLGLFAYLEQPTFLALLMYRMAPGWRGLVATWTFACWFWVSGATQATPLAASSNARQLFECTARPAMPRAQVVSKAASLGLAIYLMVGHWPVMPTWVRGTYIALWGLMISLQVNSLFGHIVIRAPSHALKATQG